MSAPASKITGGGYGSEDVAGSPYSGGSSLPEVKTGGESAGLPMIPKTMGGRRRRRTSKRSRSRRSKSSSRRSRRR